MRAQVLVWVCNQTVNPVPDCPAQLLVLDCCMYVVALTTHLFSHAEST